jgi:hypothetical protein
VGKLDLILTTILHNVSRLQGFKIEEKAVFLFKTYQSGGPHRSTVQKDDRDVYKELGKETHLAGFLGPPNAWTLGYVWVPPCLDLGFGCADH